MTEEDPDLLAGDNLDRLRGRNPYSPMSERFRLTELLENARYQNDLLVQKCRELEKERDEARREAEAKEKINATLTSSFDELRRERDEARWEVCGFHHLTGFLAGDYANSRGWNYFNDERKWPKFSQSVTDFQEFLRGQDKIFLESNDRLRKENEQLRKERDEARREAMLLLSDRASTKEMNEEYKKRGWEYLKDHPSKLKISVDDALKEMTRLDEEMGLL